MVLVRAGLAPGAGGAHAPAVRSAVRGEGRCAAAASIDANVERGAR